MSFLLSRALGLSDFSHATVQLVDAIKGVAPRGGIGAELFGPTLEESALPCTTEDSYAGRVFAWDVRPEISCPRCREICAQAAAQSRVESRRAA